MDTKTILIAGAAFVGALALSRRAGASTTAAGGDAQRLAGIDHLYRMSAAQQAAVEAAQSTNREILASELARANQPDFYI